MKKIIKGVSLFLIVVLILIIGIIFCVNSFFHIQAGNLLETHAMGVSGKNGMVVSAHPKASQIGVEILKKGGNAYDAAIAVQFALAVAYPRAGNIGGGGFLVYRTSGGEVGSLDFRERAPGSAHRDMYLDENGAVVSKLSINGHLAAGVPGTVDGMLALHEKLGSFPFEALIQPAIKLAREGVVLTAKGAKGFNTFQEKFARLNAHIPYVVKKVPWEEGERVVHAELADTLERIRDKGRAGFYQGKTADLIVKEMQTSNGIITHEDLESYSSVWRDPIVGKYKEYKVISMPPPSSGGIALVQLLMGSSSMDLKGFGYNDDRTVHMMTELERRVYADRAVFLGDPDFFHVPVRELISSPYLKKRMASIDPKRKTDSKAVREGDPAAGESLETTHFSIVDKWGNAAAVTTTLNSRYGGKVMVRGGGFFLNNEVDDFSVKPGVPNQFGLVGGEANAIEPGKRMLSSMTPTILEKEGRLFMVVGTPGGSTIITSVYQTILNVIEHSMSMQQAVTARRVHSQWLPDLVIIEKGAMASTDLIQLALKGHKPVIYPMFSRPLGMVDAILVRDDGSYEGAADFTRGIDDTAMGY